MNLDLPVIANMDIIQVSKTTLLTIVLLNPDIPCFANSTDPDQLASEEANWSGSVLFAIKYHIYNNNLDQVTWLAEN